ncbi:hypothetical protein PMI11_02249, partial [Rhizobium sp. CF142]
YALILNGQATKGLEFVERAAKVDPNWTPWRHFLKGFGLFATQRYDEATIELQAIRSGTETFDAWSRYLGGQLLLSMAGRLGRIEGTMEIRQELDAHARDENAGAFSGLLAMNGFPFKNYDDTRSLLVGLTKSGVPELPFNLDPASPLRLNGQQIKNVFFGHELAGTELETGESAVRKTSADGKASVNVGKWHGEGSSQIEGDAICSWFPTLPRNCYAVFVDKDAKAGMDGYLYVRPSARFRLFLFR